MENIYTIVNKSFKKIVVYRIGLDAGFFSEYNNMILAMVWCLKNNYQFQLCSYDANFGFSKGWRDYFVPFCTEVSNGFNIKYNHRPIPFGYNRYYPFIIRAMQKLSIVEPNYAYIPFTHKLGTKLGLGKLITQDIFVKARGQDINEAIDIPKLRFHGTLRSLCKNLTDFTWRFNAETQIQIEKMIKELKLPNNYIGFHIRCGDKFIEFQKMPTISYIETAETISDIRTAFVLTDDYRIITELMETYPSWRFYTFCQPWEKGYYNSEFRHLNFSERRDSHIRLFSSMIVFEKAVHFIGTFSSNPGMFLGMRISPEKCHGVDFDEWRIW